MRDVMKETKPAWTRMEAAGQLPDGLDANRAKQIWCQFKKKYLADDGEGAGGSLEDEDDSPGNRKTGRKTGKNGTRTPSASPKKRRKKKEEEQQRTPEVA